MHMLECSFAETYRQRLQDFQDNLDTKKLLKLFRTLKKPLRSHRGSPSPFMESWPQDSHGQHEFQGYSVGQGTWSHYYYTVP